MASLSASAPASGSVMFLSVLPCRVLVELVQAWFLLAAPLSGFVALAQCPFSPRPASGRGAGGEGFPLSISDGANVAMNFARNDGNRLNGVSRSERKRKGASPPVLTCLRKPHDFPLALFLQSPSLCQCKQAERIRKSSTRQPPPIFPNSLRRNELDAAFSEISKVGMRRKGDKISTFISLRRNDLRRIAKNKT
jgi:hypothetical protein